MKINANGITINCEIAGKGENLVLIHGAGDNLSMWYHQTPVFSRHFRVITYDVRGSGATESPEEDYSLPLLVDDLYELLKALQIKKAFFLGYSMGARIALDLTIMHPEVINALVLANSSLGLIKIPAKMLERRKQVSQLLSMNDIAGAAQIMTGGVFSPDFKSMHPEEFQRYMNVKLMNHPASMAGLLQMKVKSTRLADLKKIKCPVLLIGGENDLLVKFETVVKAHHALVNSQVVMLTAGHASPVEVPDTFNSIVLDFLLQR